jgi:flagellar motility protein MotE (MotC chaperone)
MTEFYYVEMHYFPLRKHQINKVDLNVIAEDTENFIVKKEDGSLLTVMRHNYFNTLEDAKTYIKSSHQEELEEELSDLACLKENIARLEMLLIEAEQITEADVH